METESHDLALFEAPGFHIQLTSDQPLIGVIETSRLPVASEDLRMRDQLRLLAKSSSYPSHLVPTQVTNAESRPTLGSREGRARVVAPTKLLAKPGKSAPQTCNKPSSALGAYFRNRRQRNVKPEKLAEVIVQACALENFSDASGSIFDLRKLKSGQIERVQDVTDVRCDCESDANDQDMVSPQALYSLVPHDRFSDCDPLRHTDSF